MAFETLPTGLRLTLPLMLAELPFLAAGALLYAATADRMFLFAGFALAVIVALAVFLPRRRTWKAVGTGVCPSCGTENATPAAACASCHTDFFNLQT